jgi:hypothetical protein
MKELLPTECPACGSAVTKSARVCCCDNAMCPAVGRLEYEAGLKKRPTGWYLDGRRVKPPRTVTALSLWVYGADQKADHDGRWGTISADLRCKSAFPGDYDNNEIEDRLRKAKVIKAKHTTDSEAGSFHIYFKTKADAHSFIEHVNRYIRRRWLALCDLRRQIRDLP